MRAFHSAILITILLSPAASAANHLTHESSRYLQQHAGNPVDWYPWSEAAFKIAREQHKPIFLSIGYSTCHWCQVMEEESFSDPEIGALMNAHYVAIAVDREERPDIDNTYMSIAQTMIDGPGWPLNLILTPDGKPFFAATYLPKDRLRTILDRLAAMWAEQPEQITTRAALIMQEMGPASAADDSAFGAYSLTAAYRQLASRFDPKNGGFLPVPKFPDPHQLMFLLRYWRRSGDAKALEMVETTLRAMRRGRIFDQIGFGFHRYAIDAAWNVPHYEKMLSDQALLAMTYLEAYQATHQDEYARTAREIFTYVLRDLRSPQGAFYSAQDSDERYYTASDRSKLARPARDEKIIADWNGLMIASLAFGSVVLDDDAYAHAARRAAGFVLKNLRGTNGRLLHQTGRSAYLDDYAFVTWGLLNLYEATGDEGTLQAAIDLQNDALRFYRDGGVFHLTANDAERLLVRPRQTLDGALPSGNSVELMNLVRLARMTAKPVYREAARGLLRTMPAEIVRVPSAAVYLMNGIDFLLGPSFEIVLAGNDVRPLRRAVFAGFVPDKVVLYRTTAIARIAPFTREQKPLHGAATAYVCTNYVCKLPTTDPARVRTLLEASPRP